MRRLLIVLVIIAAVVGICYSLTEPSEADKCNSEVKTVSVTLDAIQPFPPRAVLVTFSDGHVMRVSQDGMRNIQIGQSGILHLNCKNQALIFKSAK